MVVHDFWGFVEEREAIRLRKERGDAEPLTNDARLQRYWFPNIRRSNDRSNEWFNVMVRNNVDDPQTLFLATVTFRLFSRIETGEFILPMLTSVGYSRARLLILLGPNQAESPFNTRVPLGFLPGSLGRVTDIMDTLQSRLDEFMVRLDGTSMEKSHRVLSHRTGISTPLAYEIVCDLRRYGLIPNPMDAMLWAAPTKTVCKAISFLASKELRETRMGDQIEAILYMRSMLSQSKFKWEMSEVHRALCLYHAWARKEIPQRRYNQWNS